VAVVLLASACSVSLDLTPRDEAAARAAVEGYIRAVGDGDWDEAASYFTDDAVRLPMNAPAERGKTAIRAHFDVVDSVPDWTVHGVEVGGSGHVAYVTIYFTITAYVGGSAEPFSYTGKQLAVLRRQLDGGWLIETDIWNGDTGPV
jgi:uncharacterized protein (TIGR02246 family)